MDWLGQRIPRFYQGNGVFYHRSTNDGTKGDAIQEAIEAPRFFVRGDPKELFLETRLPEETLAALTRMGYTLKKKKDYDLFFGGAQGIVIDPKNKKKIGGADPRRDGAVVGY